MRSIPRSDVVTLIQTRFRRSSRTIAQRDDNPVDMCCGGDRKAIVVVLTAGGPLGIKS
jgi:hypothetical protein